jgi:hypothetical protein
MVVIALVLAVLYETSTNWQIQYCFARELRKILTYCSSEEYNCVLSMSSSRRCRRHRRDAEDDAYEWISGMRCSEDA